MITLKKMKKEYDNKLKNSDAKLKMLKNELKNDRENEGIRNGIRIENIRRQLIFQFTKDLGDLSRED